VLVAREPLVEYGRLHPAFGGGRVELRADLVGLLFFVSFWVLVGVYSASADGRGAGARWLAGWRRSRRLLGASVSSSRTAGSAPLAAAAPQRQVAASDQWFAASSPSLRPGRPNALESCSGRS